MDPLSQIHDLLPEVIDVLPPGDLQQVPQERSGTLFFVVQKNTTRKLQPVGGLEVGGKFESFVSFNYLHPGRLTAGT